MPTLEAAILRTLIYADIFSYPLNSDEIWRYLIYHEPTTRLDIEQTLACSAYLQTVITKHQNYYALTEHENTIHERIHRENIAQSLIPNALRYGRWLAAIPFVRMVTLTGSLAMHNPCSADDDYDYLLVTRPGRVWFARGVAVLLVRLVRLRGHELCPNYVTSTNQLLQQQRDIFMAHEMTQMKPIFGQKWYEHMLAENDWTRDYLPNATAITFAEQAPPMWKAWLEFGLAGWLGNRIEQWEFERKRRKFTQQIQSERSAALIDSDNAKGHFEDHGHQIVERYRQRLASYGIGEGLSLIS